jgi:hypothetical membrane protein
VDRPAPDRSSRWSSDRFRGRAASRAAGGLLLLGGVVTFMAIVTAEALYPGSYATGANEISELGGRGGQDGPISSATIFNGAMLVGGLITVGAAALLLRAGPGRLIASLLLLLGGGLTGVGLLPGGSGWPHLLSALLVFVSGGLAALASARVARGPFRYVALLLGAVSLVVLVTYVPLRGEAPLPGLGVGGLERWVAYPILLWSVGFGGYLAGGGRTVRPDRPGRSGSAC